MVLVLQGVNWKVWTRDWPVYHSAQRQDGKDKQVRGELLDMP